MAIDSNQEMRELNKSIRKPMLFYIPSSLLELSNEEITEEMKTDPMFNVLLLMKEDGNVSLYREVLDTLEIYKKEQVFNSNIYKLLEIKARNNEDAFKFLIENYVSQVRSCHDAFLWLFENFEKDLVDVSEGVKFNLEFQKSITGQHLNELEKRFPDLHSISSESIESLLTNTNFNTDESDESNIEKHAQVTATAEPEDHHNKTKKRKKLVLATVEEVDEYLLRTVFRIKIKPETIKKPK